MILRFQNRFRRRSMKELSSIAAAIQPSATLAVNTLFKQMKADGLDVVGFGAGEPDFSTPSNTSCRL